MEKIWPGTIVEESNLAQYLHILRKTLGKTNGGVPYIETLKRRGYRFNGKLRVVKADHVLAVTSGQHGETKGNVRAFGQTAAAREIAPVSVERSDNIYEVSNWRRKPRADESHSPKRVHPAWILLLTLVVVAAGALAISRLATEAPGPSSQVIPFRESEMTRLTTGGRSKHVAISPNGQYVAHITEAAEGDSLWIRQVAVANDTRIAAPSQSEFVWVTFAPDGNFVYYVSLARDKGESEMFRVPVLGGPVVKIADDIGAPTFSPDGTKFAFMRMNKDESELIIANADGRECTVLGPRRVE